jgi:hypothetical protein
MGKKTSRPRKQATTKASSKATKTHRTSAVKKAKTKANLKKQPSKRKAASKKTRSQTVATPVERRALLSSQREKEILTAGQAGDLQGISKRERSSESVEELLEEGNAFEAGILSGVERAEDEEGREVHTQEVPEDDVPPEDLEES